MRRRSRASLGTGDKVRRKSDGTVGHLTRYIGHTYKPRQFHFVRQDGVRAATDPLPARDFVLLEKSPFADLGKPKRRGRRRVRRVK